MKIWEQEMYTKSWAFLGLEPKPLPPTFAFFSLQIFAPSFEREDLEGAVRIRIPQQTMWAGAYYDKWEIEISLLYSECWVYYISLRSNVEISLIKLKPLKQWIQKQLV